MSFHPLGKLFTEAPKTWQPEDVRHFIQEYLRRELRTESLYCDEFTNGTAHVRVGTPTVAHATHLLEYDLAQTLKSTTKKDLKHLKVRLSQ